MKKAKTSVTVLHIYLILYFAVIFPATWHLRSFLTGITGHYMAGVIIGHLITLSFIIHLIGAICTVWYSISAYIKERRILHVTAVSAIAAVLTLFTVYMTLFFPVSDLYGQINYSTREEAREKYIRDLSEQYGDMTYVLPYDIPLEETGEGFGGWYLSSDNSVHVSKQDDSLSVAFTVGRVPTLHGEVRREVIYDEDGVCPTEDDIKYRYSFSFGEYEVELIHAVPMGDNTFDVKYRISDFKYKLTE